MGRELDDSGLRGPGGTGGSILQAQRGDSQWQLGHSATVGKLQTGRVQDTLATFLGVACDGLGEVGSHGGGGDQDSLAAFLIWVSTAISGDFL
jgi:hypothetical protein